MTRLQTLVLLGIASTVAPIGTAGAQDAEHVLKSTAVTLEPHFGTQSKDLTPFRRLGETLRIGEHEFQVWRKRKGIAVQKVAGRAASHTVAAARTVRLVFKSGGSKAPGASVHLRPAGKDRWEWAIVSARGFEVNGSRFLLVDVDADGAHDGFGTDGVVVPGVGVMLPLAREMIFGTTQLTFVELATDGSTAKVKVKRLAGTKEQLDAVALINGLRARHGLPGVRIDRKLSKACSAHARYLRKNGWTGYSNPHSENKGSRGYSADGHEAAQRSLIMGEGHGRAIRAFWRTFYHRLDLSDPRLDRVGISTGVGGLSVIDARGALAGNDEAGAGWKDPTLVPADGASGVPHAFCDAGEQPQPVPAPASRDFPLVALFAPDNWDVEDFSGRLVRLDGRKWVPVRTLKPEQRDFPRAFGLVPASKLAPASTYRVTYTFERHGTVETVTATFRTE